MNRALMNPFYPLGGAEMEKLIDDLLDDLPLESVPDVRFDQQMNVIGMMEILEPAAKG